MIERYFQSLKDPVKLSLLVAIFFFAGMVWSAYLLFTLQQQMIFSQAIHVLNDSLARTVFLKPAIVIATTFVIGLVAIMIAQRGKKEVIVFVEKKKEDENGQAGTSGSSDTIDLSGLRSAIQEASDKDAVLQAGLNGICQQIEAGLGAIYIVSREGDKRILELKSGFALNLGESQTISFEFGEGLIGQAASTGKSLYIDEVPEGYIKVVSGLGSASPRYLFITPLKKNQDVLGVLEVATFGPVKESVRKQIEEMGQLVSDKIG